MAKNRLRVINVVPGTRRLSGIVTRFCKGGDGIVTAFSDARLRSASAYLPEDSLTSKTSFGALVSQYRGTCGHSQVALAQSGMVEAAVKEACLALDDDSPFAASSAFPGLHRRLAATIKTLGGWRLGPEELESAAEKVGGRLAAKLNSLAEVWRSLDATLDRLGRARNDLMIADCLAADPPKTDKASRILVLAGSDFSPNDCDWLLWAAKAGASVTVVTEAHAAGGSLFEGAKQTAARLAVEPEAAESDGPLAVHLFGSGSAESAAIDVTIQSAADPLAEAEWALRGCLEDMRAGVPPHRIGIFARDVQAYGPLLAVSASRLGVNLRLSMRGPLLGNGFARLALTALQFCASDDVRALLPVAQSSYVRLDRAARAELFSRVREACAQGERQWQVLAAWAAESETTIPWLASLLRWRESALGAPAGLAEWKSRIEKMIEALGALEQVESAPAALQVRDRRAQTALRRAIAHLASVRKAGSDETLNLKQFAAICAALWENEDTGIPPAEGGVAVFHSGDAIEDVDSLYVLGMLEGTFPRRRAEDPILNDDELGVLSAVFPDHPKLPDSHDRAHAERDEFYRVCTSAAKKLCFSYPLTEEDRDNVPAFYLAELERALGGKVTKRNLPRGTLTPDADNCIAAADRALSNALAAQPEEPALNEIRTDAAKACVGSEPGQGFTPNQIRDVLDCPFRYVARHKLKLPSPRSTNRWGLLSRLPQAVGLWTATDRAHATSALEQALDAEIESHYADMSEWERTLLRSGGLRIIGEWVDREFAARETWPREPGSTQLNARFGEDPISSELPTTGGGRIKLEGVISAVSRIGDYKVAHVSQVRSPSKPRGGELQEDSDILQLGIPMMALFDRRGGVGVEVESMRGGRTLYTLYQGEEPPPIVGNAQAGLTVVRLGKPSEYMPAVKQMLADAVRRFERSAVEAQPGDHCEWCDMGELCRRSKDFGEDDSPFGEEA